MLSRLRQRTQQIREPPPPFDDWLKLVSPGWSWDWPYLAYIRTYLDKITRGEIDRLMLFLPPRSGKALAVDTPVPTPGGWASIGDLQPGDAVFDERGAPCRVIAVSPKWSNRAVYRVCPDDGDPVIADAEHEWLTRLCRKHKRFIRHTTAMLARRTSDRRAMIRCQGELQLPGRPLPIEPYVLGMWLGDGCSQHATITAGDQDIAWERAEVERAGYQTTDRATANTFGILALQTPLRELGLRNNKHIPAPYLRAGRQQRLALLQGLIDTDGYVGVDGQVEFCSTRRVLAEGVQELARSLGRKAKLTEGRATLYGKDCGPKYRVMFYMKDAARLPRKASKCRDALKTPNRYIDVTPAGIADTVCIQVDSPSHLFLCGRAMLPTHNSEMVTVRYPVWRLERDPALRVITAAYNQTLAEKFSRKSRRIARSRFELNEERQASEDWETTQGGGLRAVGVGGGITGQGGNLILIDDPIKSREEAESPTYRDRVWDWFTDDIYTRLEPHAAVILTNTRWHEDDLSGRILASESAKDWTVISLPAEAEENDPLGRALGEALCPDRFDKEALLQIRSVLGSYSYHALYQQHPMPREGGMFKREWFQIVAAPPAQAARIRYLDKAATEGAGDFSCGLLMARSADGLVYIENVTRGQWSAFQRQQIERQIAQLDAQQYQGAVRMWLEQEGGSGGKESAVMSVRRLAGVPVYLDPVRGDKAVRAMPFAAQCEAGNVRLVRGMWNQAYIDELCAFPNGRHDDQVDASSGAFNKLTLGVQRVARSYQG